MYQFWRISHLIDLLTADVNWRKFNLRKNAVYFVTDCTMMYIENLHAVFCLKYVFHYANKYDCTTSTGTEMKLSDHVATCMLECTSVRMYEKLLSII